MKGNNYHAISLHVNNKPGVLTRISQIFARRGYNIHSVVVSPAHDPSFSRMTVEAEGDPSWFEQIIAQLNKLVDVVHAKQHETKEVLERELALFKVSVVPEKRAEMLQIIEVFRGKTIDITDQTVSVEVTGNSEKIDAVERMLSPYGILEMVRTGKLIMARGTRST